MVNSVNCLVGSYERKLRIAQSKNADLTRSLAKETERARHCEDIAVERNKVNEELVEQIVALKAERDEANTRDIGLAVEKAAWDEKFEAEQKRLRDS